MKITNTSDMSFLNGYKKISNFGISNFGIYVNDDKLIKGDNIPSDHIIKKLNKIYYTYPTYKIFPQVYNYYIVPNDRAIYHEVINTTLNIGNKFKVQYVSYCKMEKFDGDLSSFLFEYIPKNILKNMNLNEAEIFEYYKFFYNMIPILLIIIG